MTVYYGDAKFASDYGSIGLDFDVAVPDGKNARVKSSGWVPRKGIDRVNVRVELNGKHEHYTLLAQNGEVHAVQNGTPEFIPTTDDDGRALYRNAFPLIAQALRNYCNSPHRQRLQDGLHEVLKQGLGIDPYDLPSTDTACVSKNYAERAKERASLLEGIAARQDERGTWRPAA